jgi:hypothetical protein
MITSLVSRYKYIATQNVFGTIRTDVAHARSEPGPVHQKTREYIRKYIAKRLGFEFGKYHRKNGDFEYYVESSFFDIQDPDINGFNELFEIFVRKLTVSGVSTVPQADDTPYELLCRRAIMMYCELCRHFVYRIDGKGKGWTTATAEIVHSNVSCVFYTSCGYYPMEKQLEDEQSIQNAFDLKQSIKRMFGRASRPFIFIRELGSLEYRRRVRIIQPGGNPETDMNDYERSFTAMRLLYKMQAVALLSNPLYDWSVLHAERRRYFRRLRDWTLTKPCLTNIPIDPFHLGWMEIMGVRSVSRNRSPKNGISHESKERIDACVSHYEHLERACALHDSICELVHAGDTDSSTLRRSFLDLKHTLVVCYSYARSAGGVGHIHIDEPTSMPRVIYPKLILEDLVSVE